MALTSSDDCNPDEAESAGLRLLSKVEDVFASQMRVESQIRSITRDVSALRMACGFLNQESEQSLQSDAPTFQRTSGHFTYPGSTIRLSDSTQLQGSTLRLSKNRSSSRTSGISRSSLNFAQDESYPCLLSEQRSGKPSVVAKSRHRSSDIRHTKLTDEEKQKSSETVDAQDASCALADMVAPYAERHMSLALRQCWKQGSSLRDASMRRNTGSFESSRVRQSTSTGDTIATDPTESPSISDYLGIPRLRSLFLRFFANRLPQLPLRPDSEVKLFFDIFGVAVLVSDFVLVPYSIAWGKGLEGIFKVSTWIAVIFWTSDLLLKFATCVTENDVCIDSWKLIAYSYLKSWFVLDSFVLSTILVELLATSSEQETTWLRYVKLLKMIRLFRVLEMMSSGKFAQLLDIFMRKIGTRAAEEWGVLCCCCKMVVIVLMANHIVACLLYWLVIRVDRDTMSSLRDTCWNWSMKIEDHYWGEDIDSAAEACDKNKVVSESMYYFTSLYWSLTAMFSGTSFLPPSNSIELIFAAAVCLFGMIFCSSVISLLTAAILDLNMSRRDFTIKMKMLQLYLHQHNIPTSLCVRMQNQIRRRLVAQKRLTDRDVPILSLLSMELRTQLRLTIYAPLLGSHPLLSACNILHDGLVKGLCHSCVTHRAMTPGEVLFTEGTPIEHAHVLLTGGVQYFFNDEPQSRDSIDSIVYEQSISEESHFSTSTRGRRSSRETSHICKPQWLCEISLWTMWNAVGSAEASDSCELLSMEASGFVDVMKSVRAIRGIVCDYACAMTEFIEKAMPCDFNDLSLGIDHDLVMALMTTKSRVAISHPTLQLLKGSSGESGSDGSAKAKGLMDLTDEVYEGLCHLTHNAYGCILRVVRIVAVEFQREDGSILAELGEWTDGEANVRTDYFLPCSKMLGWESLQDAIKRLLNAEFSHPAFDRRAYFSRVDIETLESPAYGIQTKYIRTVFRGMVGANEDELHTMTMPYPEIVEANDIEVVVVKGSWSASSKTCKLCAWLTASQFEVLKKEHGKRKDSVRHWMECNVANVVHILEEQRNSVANSAVSSTSMDVPNDVTI